MTWILQQGLARTAAPSPESCLLRWGELPEQSPGITYVCSWNSGNPVLSCLKGRESTLLATLRSTQGLSWEHPSGIWFHFTWTAWGEGEPLPLVPDAKEHFWIPLQAWIGDRWFDGPLRHERSGFLQSYVGSGLEGQLWIDSSAPLGGEIESLEPDLEKRLGLLAKESLKLALQKRLGALNADALVYSLGAYDAQDILLLVGLRVAYPQTRIYLSQSQALTPPWRRLLQNLNLETKAPSGIDTLQALRREDLWPREEPRVFFEALRRLTQSSPFLPPKIFAQLT